MKIQLYHTPEKGNGGPVNESQIILKAAKTATNETKDEFFHFSLFIVFRYILFSFKIFG